MNNLTELTGALPQSIEDALRAAIYAPSTDDADPLRIRIDNVDYIIEPGQIFAVAGLSIRARASLRKRIERRSDRGLIYMDEPFSRLDTETRSRMQDNLKNLHADMDTTIVFVTDDCEEALALGDQAVITRGTSFGND